MTTINHLILILNRTNFDKYIKCNDKEKFENITRIVKDNLGSDDMYRIKSIIYGRDEFVYYFDRTNERMVGCWC